MTPLLQIDGLSVAFGREQPQQVVHRIGFEIAAGEKVALVGESGSGKSVTALSVLRLHDAGQTHHPEGRILFEGEDLLHYTPQQMQRLRGHQISMIFQEPMTALNPVQRIGQQLMEPLQIHALLKGDEAYRQAVGWLERVGIADAERRMQAYPHQLSGGQRQRVMIAMALACRPKLVIADEPTTALDVTIQLQIMELLQQLHQEEGMAILLITHDLNMVRHFADRVCVMEQGHIVEQGRVTELFADPQHPYTQTLLASEPTRYLDESALTGMEERPLLAEAKGLQCHFPIRAGFWQRQVGAVKAVDGVDLYLRAGETLGIVGESGSGKSTLGMALLRLQSSMGEILLDGRRIDTLREAQLRPMRRRMQVVFQDPFSSLSPRMTVEQIVGEGLVLHYPELDPAARRQRIIAMLDEVGLEASILSRYPHEFSGGQRQRIAIARAVILEPELLLLDEPTSALDITVQKQVLLLLHNLQQRHGMSYLFISHDLQVIQAIAHRVMVLHRGKVVEQGETQRLFAAPQHPYTQQLLRAALFKQR